MNRDDGFLPPTQEQTIAYLEEMVSQARLAHQSSEATLAMAVARLGGEVEGAPTHRINFLQRIDALRRVEEQHGELADACDRLIRWLTAFERNEATTGDEAVAAVDAARVALRNAGRLP